MVEEKRLSLVAVDRVTIRVAHSFMRSLDNLVRHLFMIVVAASSRLEDKGTSPKGSSQEHIELSPLAPLAGAVSSIPPPRCTSMLV